MSSRGSDREPVYGDDDPQVPGGTYYCGYWGEEYTVLERHDVPGATLYKIRWASGRVSEHCTAWEPWRDRVVVDPPAEMKRMWQAGKDRAARRADEILRVPRGGAELTHRHPNGTIWDGPACGPHHDGEQPLPLLECSSHGLAAGGHFPCRGPARAGTSGRKVR